MTPTNRLRFVERKVEVPAPELGPDITKTIKVKVLQQRWAWQNVPVYGSKGRSEWRDVLLEEEEE